MQIDNNAVVTLQFILTDTDGTVIHETTDDEPMVYLHGWSELIDGLERELTGKSAGDEIDITVTPDDGYGEIDPQLVQIYNRADFGDDKPEIGMERSGKDPNGEFRLLRVIAIDGDDVTVDMNHPLAGKTITFCVRIDDVRAATETEIAHGHVHAGDGHEH